MVFTDSVDDYVHSDRVQRKPKGTMSLKSSEETAKATGEKQKRRDFQKEGIINNDHDEIHR